MPYAVLVSALGAIVGAAIALIGFHTWTALQVATIVGALSGYLLAAFSLRRHSLPLNSTLDDYRGIAGVTRMPRQYFYAAYGVGLTVAFVELPSIMFGQNVVLVICAAGCVAIFAGTLYRSWRLTNSPVKLDIFHIVGGTSLLGIFGSIGYGLATAAQPSQNIPPIELARMIFVVNAIAAMLSAILALFAFAIASSVVARMQISER